MQLIILFFGVLSLAYEGYCVITAWTVPPVSTANGTGALTYQESQAPGALATLAVTTGGIEYFIRSQPTAGKLAVVLLSGALTLEPGFFFDYETEPTYVIVVTGSDGTFTGTVTITISIADVTPDANYGPYTSFYRVDDAEAAHTAVATITAPGGTATVYSIASGNTNTDFAYAAVTGVLFTANIMARSTTAIYTLKLQAVSASTTSTAVVTVCVGTSAQCGDSDSGAARLHLSLAMLLIAIVISRIN